MSYSEWRTTKLSNLIETVSETYKFDKNQKVVLINTSDILEGKVLNHNLVLPLNIAGQFKKQFKKNDILYSEIRPANKRYAYIDFESKNYVASTKLMVLRRKNNQIDNKFLFQYLKSNDTLRTLQAIAESRSGTFPQITFKELSNLEINLPTIKEQETIANILSSLDDKIELNNKINKNLEELAQTLYKRWFVDFEFPNEYGEPYKSSGGEMVDSELGKIPKGWVIVKLESVLSSLETGNRPIGGIKDIDSGIPSIGAENVIGLGHYDYSKEKLISKEYFDRLNRGKIQDYDVLLYKDGAQLGRKTIVGSGYPHKVAAVNSHVFILRTNKKITQEYLYFNLDQDNMTQNIISLNTSSAQPGINQTSLKSLKILCPSRTTVDAFSIIAKSLLNQIFNNCNENRVLSQTRDELLPKLMSGEIEVPIKE